MKIVQLTPGTGSFHCGACIRDNALVTGLRELGHDALLVPLYLPFLVDEEDASTGTPIMLGGINMFLQQVSRTFRRTPRWVDRIFDSRGLLGLAAKRAATTSPDSLGEMTLSTLRGEEGNQVKEVRRLAKWIAATGTPDVICLSSTLLVGLVREIRSQLGPVRIVATIQGEDGFLDSLPEPHRTEAWNTVIERCREVDAFIPVSHIYADMMTNRLDLNPDRVTPVYPGIRAKDFVPAETPPSPPVVGFLARMIPEKGLSTLVEAFLALRDLNVRLRIAGSMTTADRAYVDGVKDRIEKAGQTARVDWLPNLSRDEKLEFLRSLSVLSVPATYGEAFGLYVIEAMAAGVPVVQPDHGAFPELIAETGGGTLVRPDDHEDLARGLTELLDDPEAARAMGSRGREAVLDRLTVRHMAEQVLEVFEEVLQR